MTGVGRIAEGTGKQWLQAKHILYYRLNNLCLAPMVELSPQALKSQGSDGELGIWKGDRVWMEAESRVETGT